VKLALTFHRMLPSALCQGVGVLKLGVFRGSIAWPVVPPVYASYLTLRSCPQDSEPVWLARPSPYGSFIRYTLPVPCLRTGLTLRRYDTPPRNRSCESFANPQSDVSCCRFRDDSLNRDGRVQETTLFSTPSM
jgi:hypothetical protein